MNIQYIKADPSGNTTIFVLNPVDPALRSSLANVLLQPDCVGAEQVAYLSHRPGEVVRVDMMGGEFCGNASRSAAAYMLMSEGKEKGEYAVSCSGCAEILQANAAKRADGTYDAYIEMPRPSAVEAVIVDVGGMPGRFFRVELPGIVHFVHFMPAGSMDHKERLWQAVQDYVTGGEAHMPEAYGLVLFDPASLRMVPAVYVAATDTLYWEQSCGSGSAAVAAALACVGKKDVSCTIRQPGGVISIAAAVGGEEKELQRIFIGGPVSFSGKEEIDISI